MANNQLPTASVMTFKKCNVITQKYLDELKKNAELNRDQEEELTNLKITHLKLIEKSEKKKTKWHQKKLKLKNQNKQLIEEINHKNQTIKMLNKTIKKIQTAATDATDTAIPALVITAPIIKRYTNKCCLCHMYLETVEDLEFHIDNDHSEIFRNPIKL